MDENTKILIKQAYVDAMLKYGAEYLSDALLDAGIDADSPEVIAYLKELDIEFGIF